MTRRKRTISGKRRFRRRRSWRRESQLVEAFTKPVFEGHRGQGPNCPNYNSDGPVSIRGRNQSKGQFQELFFGTTITTSPKYCDDELQLVAGKCPSYGGEGDQGWRCGRSVSSKGKLGRGAEGREMICAKWIRLTQSTPREKYQVGDGIPMQTQVPGI
jgi:hypothetical protein